MLANFKVSVIDDIKKETQTKEGLKTTRQLVCYQEGGKFSFQINVPLDAKIDKLAQYDILAEVRTYAMRETAYLFIECKDNKNIVKITQK